MESKWEYNNKECSDRKNKQGTTTQQTIKNQVKNTVEMDMRLINGNSTIDWTLYKEKWRGLCQWLWRYSMDHQIVVDDEQQII